MVLDRKLDTEPLCVGIGVGSHVDDGVESRAADTPEEFDLSVRRLLPVQPSKGATGKVVREIDLFDVAFEPGRCELFTAECAGKKAAFVVAGFELDYICPSEGCLGEFHKPSLRHFKLGSPQFHNIERIIEFDLGEADRLILNDRGRGLGELDEAHG